MKNENFNHCLSIAKDLEKIAAGELFKCPDCGEWISEADCEYNEAHDIITCQCGAEINSEDMEPVSMWDCFSDALDIEYYSKGRGAEDYTGVRILVACGGPNIYIDTKRRAVELYWWTEYASAEIWSETAEAIDEIFSEMWACSC